MPEKIQTTREGTLGIVLLDRPEAFNAFDLEMVTALADALISLGRDEGARGVILTGKGKAFCAGGDLKWALGHAAGPPAAFHELAARFHQAILEIRRMGKPVVAALNGPAAGGGFSLALACDFRVMDRSAFLRQAYTSSGLCIDGGGTFMLPRLVGLSRALEIAAMDPKISAEQALEWGLATRLTDDGGAVREATALAGAIAAGSLLSFAKSKRLLTDACHTPLEAQLQLEREALRACAAHPDGREGLRAFSEKRKPSFG